MSELLPFESPHQTNRILLAWTDSDTLSERLLKMSNQLTALRMNGEFAMVPPSVQRWLYSLSIAHLDAAGDAYALMHPKPRRRWWRFGR